MRNLGLGRGIEWEDTVRWCWIVEGDRYGEVT
jgi:hypothetical protein